MAQNPEDIPSHSANPLDVPLKRDSLNSIPTSFATVSVGAPDDDLIEKLAAISEAGFQAVELGFPDLQSFATKYHKREVGEDDYEDLCKAGEEVKKLCEQHKLSIMMLQPFANFEGWPKESKERQDAFDRAKGWIRIMHAIGTDMLQVGSSDSEGISSDPSVIADDLRELADMLSEHDYRLAYENWCWSTHAPTWKGVYEIIKLVDRPNVGLCLDTFQTAGGEWADPTTQSGMIESSGMQEAMERKFLASVRDLAATIPPEKIYLLQISDAYKVSPPLEDKIVDGLRPRGRWSHDFRPFPFNGGYLPVTAVAKAVLDTGARCWFSYEVFDAGPNGKSGMKHYKKDDFCIGAMQSHARLLDECVKLSTGV